MRTSDWPQLEWGPLSRKGRPGLVKHGKDGPEGSRMGLVAQLLAECQPAWVITWWYGVPTEGKAAPAGLMMSFPSVIHSGEDRALLAGVTNGSARNVSLCTSRWPFPSTHLTLT